ncbi:MAG: Ig-like domain-containing protein [Bacteroidota bacterium]
MKKYLLIAFFAGMACMVSAQNVPPVAQDDFYSIPQDVVLNVPSPGVMANDSDANGDVLTVTIVSPPAMGVITMNSSGSFTYVPNALYSGPDMVVYRVTDPDGASATATVFISIQHVNQAPVANDDSFMAVAGQLMSIPPPAVLFNDYDADGDVITPILVQSPLFGTLSLSASGGMEYLPNGGFTGYDSALYMIYDPAGLTDTGTIYIQVIPDSDTCNCISGTVFKDLNSSCDKDSGDYLMSYTQLYYSDDSGSIHPVYTDYTGVYRIPTLTGVTYKVFHADPFLNACSDTLILIGNSNNPGADFALHCSTSAADLGAFTSASVLRPGFAGEFFVGTTNKGCTDENATLTLTLNEQLIVTGTSPTASSIQGNTVTWHFTQGMSMQGFKVAVSVPAGVQLGDTLCATADLSGQLTDINPENNRAVHCPVVRGAYDPNDKTCYVRGTEEPHFQVNDELVYRIRFQNTGTDSAFNISVLDTIDPLLDLSSLEIISASHAMTITVGDDRVVNFSFPGIMLPDSNVNESLSHGEIWYKIKPLETLLAGDRVNNTAYIYFDFNEAVITNTTVNAIPLETGVGETGTHSFNLFPNPASGEFRIVSSGNIGEIVIRDLTGRMMVHTRSHDPIISIGTLRSGIYMVEAEVDKIRIQQKLMVK